jgi:hypothetical protein
VNERAHNTGNDFEWIINISAFVITLCACPFPSTPKAADKGAASNAHVTQCSERPKSRERAVFVEKCVRAVRVVYFRANTRSAARPKAAAVSCEALGARRMTQNRYYYGEQCAV